MPDHSNADLFQPVALGAIQLANRIAMAPLQRARAGSAGIPGPMNAEYYAQRASAGVIISEATWISFQGRACAYSPGICNTEQVEGWRRVTDAVHERGGKILCQLWHGGRISHPSLQLNGETPVAPSAIKPEGLDYTEHGFDSFVEPRALRQEEIPGILEQYRSATENAQRAGFDGVEIHAANGYLIDQFLKDKTNRRTDVYGGSIANRVRFMIEVVETVVKAWSPGRTGIRLSPIVKAGDIADSHPAALFLYAVNELNRFNLAYLHILEGVQIGEREVEGGFDWQKLRRAFHGLYMANNGYDLEMALKARRENLADLIAFGRPFISNPDLVRRLKSGAPLADWDVATFYGGDARGYIDYPSLDQAVESPPKRPLGSLRMI
jgi:N-ethylmaleimide reductase